MDWWAVHEQGTQDSAHSSVATSAHSSGTSVAPAQTELQEDARRTMQQGASNLEVILNV